MARHIILARHGDVGPEYAGRYIGRTDPPLSELGRRQAAALAAAARADKFFASPLARARQTAGLVVENFQIRADLREVDFGRWDGGTFDEIQSRDPALVTRWAEMAPDFGFPEGETVAGFLARTKDAARLLAAEPADAVLAVTHGGVIRAMLCHLLGLDVRCYLLFRIDHASLTTVDLFDGKGVLAGLNDTCHLKGL